MRGSKSTPTLGTTSGHRQQIMRYRNHHPSVAEQAIKMQETISYVGTMLAQGWLPIINDIGPTSHCYLGTCMAN